MTIRLILTLATSLAFTAASAQPAGSTTTQQKAQPAAEKEKKKPAPKPPGPGSGDVGGPRRSMTGTVKAISDDSLTISSGGRDMVFLIDDKTTVTGKGASTATGTATTGKLSLTDLVKKADHVSVTYQESGSTRRASSVRLTNKDESKK